MKRLKPILLMMTLLLTGCTAPVSVPEANAYRQITMQQAVEMMEKDSFFVEDGKIVIFYPPYKLSYYNRGFVDYAF